MLVGRNANVILADENPLRIFVYAELESRIQRCKERETEGIDRSNKAYEKQIKEVDKLRAKNHDILSTYRWGDMRGYDLCLNTSYLEVRKLIPRWHNMQQNGLRNKEDSMYQTKEHSLVQGNILKSLISFAFPVLLALFLQVMYGAADLIIIGQFADTYE